MQTQYKAYTLGEALCSTLNLVILTINFDFNIICVQCNVIRNFIHIIPTPIIRSHRGLTNVQAISKAYLSYPDIGRHIYKLINVLLL